MALWEYKTITSGVHGFATPALLETFLNNLGKDEWEIVNYQPSPTNPLAFTGLVRRSTQRDWVPPEIPAHTALAPSAPASQASKPAPAPEPAPDTTPTTLNTEPETPNSGAGETAAAAIRPVRDTERDQDPDAQDDDDTDEWDDLDIDDDLPTFFDALKPHYRNNQRGPGKSVALDYLVKRWDLPETDILAALKECGLTVPETEDAAPEYFEFEDDLYWVNRTNRGQYFINTREKPRAKFRIAAAKPLSPDDPAYAELAAERAEELARAEAKKQKTEDRRQGTGDKGQRTEAESQTIPSTAETQNSDSEISNFGAAATVAPAHKVELTDATRELLARIRPLMRRNRHGPGYSGSINFLAHALKTTDAELSAQVTTALGVPLPETNGIKPTFVEIENGLYWLNKDSRGNVWINGREIKHRPAAQAAEPATVPSPTPRPAEQLELPAAPAPDASESSNSGLGTRRSELTAASPLAAVRLLLKPNKSRTGFSGEVGNLARTLNKPEAEFIATLTAAGLVVPPDADTKPTFVAHAGEIFWFGLFEKDGETSLWLNAKAAKKKVATKPRTRKTKIPNPEIPNPK